MIGWRPSVDRWTLIRDGEQAGVVTHDFLRDLPRHVVEQAVAEAGWPPLPTAAWFGRLSDDPVGDWARYVPWTVGEILDILDNGEQGLARACETHLVRVQQAREEAERYLAEHAEQVTHCNTRTDHLLIEHPYDPDGCDECAIIRRGVFGQ